MINSDKNDILSSETVKVKRWYGIQNRSIISSGIINGLDGAIICWSINLSIITSLYNGNIGKYHNGHKVWFSTVCALNLTIWKLKLPKLLCITALML